MSKVITPPDIIIEPPVYLIINAPIEDVQMIGVWLQIEEKNYTIHLYHEGMDNRAWLLEAASISNNILFFKPNLNTDTLQTIINFVAKIIWFGPEEKYARALDFFVHND